MRKSLILLSVVAMLVVACNKKDSNTDGSKAEEYAKVNKCINGVMQTYYLWNKRVPRYRNADIRNPEEYFESLLYAFLKNCHHLMRRKQKKLLYNLWKNLNILLLKNLRILLQSQV